MTLLDEVTLDDPVEVAIELGAQHPARLPAQRGEA